MKTIDQSLLDAVSGQAAASDRLRMNHNFHVSFESKSQRLLNAMEPGTKVPVHRHPETSETYVLLRGKMRVLIFADDSTLLQDVVLDVAQGHYGVHIEAGEWHSVEILEPGTVMFECKDGPYTPLEDRDIQLL
jgi:cupin fold WbuC family metalloprotein